MVSKILVLGDSILWGQGLHEPNKLANRLAGLIADKSGGPEPTIVRFAHSGATVWETNHTGPFDALDPTPPPLLPAPVGVTDDAIRSGTMPAPSADIRDNVGEVPRTAPFTLAQLLSAKDALGADSPDLIFVHGGINDVGILNIIFPQKDVHCLQQRTASFSGYMANLLTRIHALFPSAKIIVGGYYPIVSRETNFDKLFSFHRGLIAQVAHSLDVWHGFGFDCFEDAVRDAMTGIAGDLHLGPVATAEEHLVRLSRAFSDTIHQVLQSDIAAFNAQAGGHLAHLAIPVFGPENSIFAPKSFLWEVSLLLEPEDEVVQQRESECRSAHDNLLELFVCRRASLGHPNLQGEQAYIDAAIVAATELGVI